LKILDWSTGVERLGCFAELLRYFREKADTAVETLSMGDGGPAFEFRLDNIKEEFWRTVCEPECLRILGQKGPTYTSVGAKSPVGRPSIRFTAFLPQDFVQHITEVATIKILCDVLGRELAAQFFSAIQADLKFPYYAVKLGV